MSFIVVTKKAVLVFVASMWVQAAVAETARLIATQKFTTLDPHVGYDWLSYESLGLICGNLMVQGEYWSGAIPDLATKIDLLNGGKSLVFTLNPTRKFHNGQPVRAQDVVYSLNRVINPELKSGGASLFQAIKGFEDYRNGKTDRLEGVSALSELQVQIDLERPSNSFLSALATNFGCVMPEGHNPAPFDLPISAGPFRADSFSKRHTYTLQKFDIDPPVYAENYDTIIIYAGLSIDEVLARFAEGKIDLILDSLAWETISRKKQSAQSAVRSNLQSHQITYLALNMQLPPLDDIRVRRAINLAIDRDSLVAQLNGAAAATSNFLPPGMLKDNPNRKKNIYDQAAAKELLSGFDLPILVDFYAVNSDPYRSIAYEIIDQLRTIGIIATPRFGTHEEVLDVATDPKAGQIIYSDGLGWYADYNDPSNFYFPLLTKASIGEDGWNWSVYQNPELEELALQADSLIGDAQKEKRENLWQEIFNQIEKDAAVIPLYNRLGTTFTIGPNASNSIFYDGLLSALKRGRVSP